VAFAGSVAHVRGDRVVVISDRPGRAGGTSRPGYLVPANSSSDPTTTSNPKPPKDLHPQFLTIAPRELRSAVMGVAVQIEDCLDLAVGVVPEFRQRIGIWPCLICSELHECLA
jgi:hypothetical protein